MKKIIISVLLIFCLIGTCYAFDLNAPAKKKVTIKTEIDRGLDAIPFGIGMDQTDYVILIFKVLKQEEKNNTDTDAFLLGAYFEAWQDLCIRYPEDSSVDFFFKEFRKKQKELGMDDKALYSALSPPKKLSAIKDMIEKYENQHP